MILWKTLLENTILVFKPSTIFEDHRGQYIETYNHRTFEGITKLAFLGVSIPEFVCDDISVSRKGVFRGIHGDFETWKLVSCLRGAFYLVIVNNAVLVPSNMLHTGLLLSERNHLQVLIPPGYGNGHLSLEEGTIFHYKQSTYYDRDSQFTIPWRSLLPGLWLPFEPEILSVRDGG